MKKLTVKDFIELTTDGDLVKEVYTKLLALRTEYEIDKATAFNPEFFETCYKVAFETVEKAKATKFQLCCCIVDIVKDLEQIGFTRQQLAKVASLYIE